MVSVGEKVRCYHSPSHLWTVEKTDVSRDVDVDAKRVARLPSGDTLIRQGERAMVCSSDMLKPRSEETGQ